MPRLAVCCDGTEARVEGAESIDSSAETRRSRRLEEGGVPAALRGMAKDPGGEEDCEEAEEAGRSRSGSGSTDTRMDWSSE